MYGRGGAGVGWLFTGGTWGERWRYHDYVGDGLRFDGRAKKEERRGGFDD